MAEECNSKPSPLTSCYISTDVYQEGRNQDKWDLEGENRWRHDTGGGSGWEMLEEGESSPDANDKNGRDSVGGANSLDATTTHMRMIRSKENKDILKWTVLTSRLLSDPLCIQNLSLTHTHIHTQT